MRFSQTVYLNGYTLLLHKAPSFRTTTIELLSCVIPKVYALLRNIFYTVLITIVIWWMWLYNNCIVCFCGSLLAALSTKITKLRFVNTFLCQRNSCSAFYACFKILWSPLCLPVSMVSIKQFHNEYIKRSKIFGANLGFILSSDYG